MKKVIVILIISVTTIAVGRAQYFVEGSLGVNYDDTEVMLVGYPTEKVESIFLFSISPTFGYWLNDNVAVGARLSLSRKTAENLLVDPDDPDIRSYGETTAPGWRFAVFGRYKITSWRKFSVLLETSAHIGKSKQKEKAWGVTKVISTRSEIGIRALPIITYDLTDKITLTTVCNFLNFGVNFLKTKQEDVTTKYSYVGFDTSSYIITLAGIEIGFIYNF